MERMDPRAHLDQQDLPATEDPQDLLDPADSRYVSVPRTVLLSGQDKIKYKLKEHHISNSGIFIQLLYILI